MLVQLLYLLLSFIIAAVYRAAVSFVDEEADTEAYMRWQTLKADLDAYSRNAAAWFKAIFVFPNR